MAEERSDTWESYSTVTKIMSRAASGQPTWYRE